MLGKKEKFNEWVRHLQTQFAPGDRLSRLLSVYPPAAVWRKPSFLSGSFNQALINPLQGKHRHAVCSQLLTGQSRRLLFE
jgi:hypothetical protein